MAKVNKIKFDDSKEWYYSLAETGSILGKARSTMMRLLPSWKEATGQAPRRDHGGRWFLPVKSVHALRDDAELYLKLAGRATTWQERLKKLEDENKKLKAQVRKLKKSQGNLLERLASK
jgi:hypothetical protein